MSSAYVLMVTAAVVVTAVVLVVRARLHPAVVLVAAALAIGLLTGLGVEGAVKAVTEGFGGIMADVGLLIAFGVLIGSLLQAMGAIEAVVRALFERTGVRRMPLAFALSCARVLQLIFIYVLIVIVAPLVRRVAARIGPGGLARMATALTVGCACGVMMVVPGVGVLALAGVLDVPLGRMLLLGLLVAVPTVALTTTVGGAVLAGGTQRVTRRLRPYRSRPSPRNGPYRALLIEPARPRRQRRRFTQRLEGRWTCQSTPFCDTASAGTGTDIRMNSACCWAPNTSRSSADADTTGRSMLILIALQVSTW